MQIFISEKSSFLREPPLRVTRPICFGVFSLNVRVLYFDVAVAKKKFTALQLFLELFKAKLNNNL